MPQDDKNLTDPNTNDTTMRSPSDPASDPSSDVPETPIDNTSQGTAPSATMTPQQASDSYAPAPNSVITAPQVPKKYGGKKAIYTMFAIGLLLVGAISTMVLVQRQSLVQTSAWDCGKYVFVVSKTGTVTVQNGSGNNEPAQKADVYIDNVKVKTLDVPALTGGSGATLGTVTVPASGGFSWKVDGTVDCDDSGSYQANTPTPTTTSNSPTPTTPNNSPTPTTPNTTAACGDVKAYDTNWKLLTSDDLKSLKTGAIVRFAVAGTTNSGSFDKARFTINGTQRPEVTTKKPSTDEFYDEYTIPAGTTSFTVSAQVHHVVLGWF